MFRAADHPQSQRHAAEKVGFHSPFLQDSSPRSISVSIEVVYVEWIYVYDLHAFRSLQPLV